jgi:UDPglucose--hexose-1-phosphate uridylyltransferase
MEKWKNDDPPALTFDSFTRTARLLSPLKNFELDEQKIEFRKNPLLGYWCRINIGRSQRVKQAHAPSDYDETIQEVITRTREKCFFCPENLEKTTPKFPPEITPEGRLRKGNFVLLPNLFPFSEHHAVGVLSEKHFLRLNEITKEILENSFAVSVDYFNRIFKLNNEMKFCSINMNYMPPAGASIVHPHIQITSDIKGSGKLLELLQKSQVYYEVHGTNYWTDLVGTEKWLKERFIGTSGDVSWLTNYAPMGKNEVFGIVTRPISHFRAFDEALIKDFSEGLSKIFKGLWERRHVRSLNFTIYSSPIDTDSSDYFRVHVKMVSRPVLRPFYTSDTAFMENFYAEPIIETAPEDVASDLRDIW